MQQLGLLPLAAFIVIAASVSARDEGIAGPRTLPVFTRPQTSRHCEAHMYAAYQSKIVNYREWIAAQEVGDEESATWDTFTAADETEALELKSAISDMKLNIRPVPELNERILVTYAYCDPEVGYGQGMKVVLATLIRRLGLEADETVVFRHFVNMMDRKPLLLRDRFKKGVPQTMTAKLDSTLEKDMPKMYNHVANEIMFLPPSAYVSEWFRTMFSDVDRIPETLTEAVWDAADTSAAPWDALLQFAVCFFRVRERDILAAALEDVGTVIKRKITGEEASTIITCHDDWKNYASSWMYRLTRKYRSGRDRVKAHFQQHTDA